MERFPQSQISAKKLKSSLSPPPPPTKLCLICFTGEYEAHIVSIEDGDGDGDGGDDSEFVRRSPDIRFKNFGESCFCMVDSTLYIFSAPPHGQYSPAMRTVYSYSLLPQPKRSGVVTLDAADDSLGTGIHVMCPKFCPFAVNYGPKILLFSTRISVAKYEWNADIAKRVDFEIYDTKNNIVERLPPLLFMEVTCVVQFFDQATKTWNPIFGASLKQDTVIIEGFSVVNDRTFVVLTDLPGMFCIDLLCPDHGWQLYEGAAGVTLLGYRQTFVTRSGFNVDDIGVYRSAQAGKFEVLLNTERYGYSESRLYFPRSSSLDMIPVRGCFSCSSTFVEDDYPRIGGTAFVVKILLDDEGDEPYPYWVVDKLALDFEKVSAKDLVDIDDDEWAKCVASHKYVGELKCSCFICLALFPF